jgi:hypothetical protein
MRSIERKPKFRFQAFIVPIFEAAGARSQAPRSRLKVSRCAKHRIIGCSRKGVGIALSVIPWALRGGTAPRNLLADLFSPGGRLDQTGAIGAKSRSAGSRLDVWSHQQVGAASGIYRRSWRARHRGGTASSNQGAVVTAMLGDASTSGRGLAERDALGDDEMLELG